MIERGHGARFLFKPGAGGRVSGGEEPGRISARRRSEARVFGAIDFAHPPAPMERRFHRDRVRAEIRGMRARNYICQAMLGLQRSTRGKSTLAALVESDPFGSAQGRALRKCAKDGQPLCAYADEIRSLTT